MQVNIESKPAPDGHILCSGRLQPVLSGTVNMNGRTAVRDTAICPDCGQRVMVWLSGPIAPSGQLGQWILDQHSEPRKPRL
jgi:hypothetical protein